MSRKKTSIWRKIVDSKTFEFRLIKRLLSSMVGALVGYGEYTSAVGYFIYTNSRPVAGNFSKVGRLINDCNDVTAYYSVSFSQAFRSDESYYSSIVKWTVLSASSIGSFLSSQCCCIAALCIPTLAAKSGRKVVQAALFTWILAGPVTNIFYHSTEAIRSVTCIVKLQENQTKLLVDLLIAPIVKGQGLIVNESESLPRAQHYLENEMDGLKGELLTGIFGDSVSNDILERRRRKKRHGIPYFLRKGRMRAVGRQYKNLEEYDTDPGITITDVVDMAANLRRERTKMCHEIFDKAYEECRIISGHSWNECMANIAIPLFNHIICGIIHWVAEGKCSNNLLDIKNRKCGTFPMNDNAVNGNYSVVDNTVANVDKEFQFGLYWEIPKLKEKTVVMTADEIAHTVQGEYLWRKLAMTMTVSIARKLLALIVILVLRESAKYNSNYLADITFDNGYVTSYFVHKDKQRKRKKKRHLLPLTNLEKKYVMRPTALFLRPTEKKSLVVKGLTITLQALVTSILYIFDGILFFIMELISQHGRNDYRVTGRHMLQAKVGGNGTISHMMRMVFSGFQDNDRTINVSGSNEECLPISKKLDTAYVTMTWMGFLMLIGMTLMEGYVLRVRRVICATFFPKREKRRIIYLYNEMLRQRKQNIQSVRKAILKLALTKTLNQRYGLFESLRVKFPKLGKLLMSFGIGKHRCLTCEAPETNEQRLWRCSNKRCRMMYCNVCWLEIDEMCWACNSEREEGDIEEESDHTR